MAETGLRDQILSLFLSAGDVFLSGEDISQKLGVSRAAVWKHIGHLREMGYAIEAVPSRGYHLLEQPDLLLPMAVQSGLETQFVAKRVEYFSETDSTNQRAQQLGEQGAEHGTVVIAEGQSAGRGRMGRAWSSPAAVNLYTSILLRPKILPIQAAQLTFLSAVAVARTVEAVADIQVAVKWPNDILLDGEKIAGLLNEISAEMEGIHYVVLGIGVNLNMTADQFPDDLRYPATSLLLATGQRIDRLAFAQELYRQLDGLYQLFCQQGFVPIRLAWEALFEMVGRQVSVDCGGTVFTGCVEGIAEDGALLLRLASGDQQEIYAGDVRPV
ncbi:MAG: biotin--[acetyl-CoA-carboxylase] ligase [Desulfobacteraceae bacterium 4572_35.2]|nr:MAG: biotin--[acetyl-CoA-carboxylase] ligase [Desulfobacteraceae bacterium 4572_35.2]